MSSINRLDTHEAPLYWEKAIVATFLPALQAHSDSIKHPEGAMTNLQLLLSIGVPSFLVLLNIVLSRSDIQALRAEMNQLRKDLTADIAKLREDVASDMLQLRKELSADIAKLREDVSRDLLQLRKDLNADMTQLRDGIHRDMVLLHERVAVVETRQNQ